nr:ribonuclease H-like domain-containing protein [Tanacetum cinerariifolium]
MSITSLSSTHEPTTPCSTSNTHITSPAVTAHGNALTTNTHHMVTRTKARLSKPLARMNCHATTTSPIPRSHLHALRNPNWHKAMVDEYNALILSGTWALMPRPANVNIVRSMDSDVAYLPLYVDDIILTVSSTALLQRIITLLHSEFAMTDLSSLNYFLGSLQYLTFTRPDISYDVQQICLYMHDPRDPHFTALKHILRYVRGTIDHGLQLHVSSTSQLTTYTYADWVGCPVTRRSTFRYCMFLGDNLLSWSAKRQVTLSHFSAEVEYRGVANVVAETAWI